MKYNTIFMYDTYTYDMYNYDIKYNVEFFYVIIKYRNFPYRFVRGMFEKLARRMARWHVYCHVGT